VLFQREFVGGVNKHKDFKRIYFIGLYPYTYNKS